MANQPLSHTVLQLKESKKMHRKLVIHVFVSWTSILTPNFAGLAFLVDVFTDFNGKMGKKTLRLWWHAPQGIAGVVGQAARNLTALGMLGAGVGTTGPQV